MRPDVNSAQRLDETGLGPDARAGLRCVHSKELEEDGHYEAACSILGGLWRGVGERPGLDGLSAYAKAEVLLRAGCLSSSIASVQRTTGRQEAAKDLISESIRVFESLGEAGRVAEAEVELAWCYWREGAFDETRTMLRHAVRMLGEGGHPHVRAVALLRSAIVEIETDQLREALRILTDAAPLFEAGDKHALKGSFHNTLAVVYESLGRSPGAEAYVDRALVEYTAASFHFEQAGHVRYRARVENNIGLLFYKIARFGDAFEHLRCARRLFAELGDGYNIAQVDDTQARALLAQGKTAEAEELARAVVRTLERGDQQALLAEALTTHGVALGRLKRSGQAYAVLLRAAEVAEEVGDFEGAGSAALALLEEVGDCLSAAEVRSLYERADQLLARSQNPEHLRRLRLCARRAVSATVRTGKTTGSFIRVSEKASSVVRMAHRAAALNVPVLIRGEIGTGKEALARLMHEWGGRAGKFVVLNCAASPDRPDESPTSDRAVCDSAREVDWPRLTGVAAGGTLFLDEVGDLSMENQAALLRLVARDALPQVGARASQSVDVSIIAATRRDLGREVATGAFRADLLNALGAFCVEIPPLRARAEDIPVMALGLIEDAGRRHGKRVTFTPESVEAMRQLALKANGRELHDLIEHTFLAAPDGAVVSAEAVDTVALRESRKGDFAEPWANCSLEEEVRQYEGRLIQSALNAAQGRVTHAAHLLGTTHQSLAFIINARQRDLIGQRKPPRKRRASVIRPALKKELEKERMLARTDELTGIANKRAFHESVSAEIRRSARYRRPFTVAFLDVDDFKRVNDQHGHGVGDAILRTISGSIKASLRAVDVVARLGGDEFAILLPEADTEAAQAALRNVQDNLAVAMHERGIPVTLSVGAVTCLNPKCEVDELIGVADSQMYAAKFGRKGSANFVTLEEGPEA